MNIGFIVNPNCAISGMGSGVLKQAKMWAYGLRRLGHEVQFVAPQNNGEIVPVSGFDIIHYFHFGHWLESFSKLPKSVDQRRFFSPIIDSTSSRFAYGAFARLPLDLNMFSFGPRLLRKTALCTTVLARSEFEREFMLAICPECNIKVVPIALTVEEGVSSFISADIPTEFVLFIGGMFSPRKNVVRLIEACDKIKLPLVLVGNQRDTPYMRRVSASCAQSNTPVINLGFLPEENIRWLYKNCTIFCLPSLIEGVGQVAMEALHYGAKVVMTEIGGPKDYFGEHAVYVNPLSVDSISAGMNFALQQSVDSLSLANLLRKYEPVKVAEILIQVYTE